MQSVTVVFVKGLSPRQGSYAYWTIRHHSILMPWGKGEGGWKIRGGMIKKLRNEEGVTKINRHRSWGAGGLCISFSHIEHTGEHFQTVHLHGSTNTKKVTTVRERPHNIAPRSGLARDLCYNRYSVTVGFLLKLRLRPHYHGEIWKHGYLSTVSPTISSNPSRKRSSNWRNLKTRLSFYG